MISDTFMVRWPLRRRVFFFIAVFGPDALSPVLGILTPKGINLASSIYLYNAK